MWQESGPVPSKVKGGEHSRAETQQESLGVAERSADILPLQLTLVPAKPRRDRPLHSQCAGE